jgi:hypothetical protein
LNSNRTIDIIFTKEIDGVDYPFHGLAHLGPRIPPLFSSYSSFYSFSEQSIPNLFSRTTLNNISHNKVDTFSSIWLENRGDGSFHFQKLPNDAQMSPITAMLSIDSKNHECSDLIIAGNIHYTEANVARADAGNGLYLSCKPGSVLNPLSVMESGFYAPKNVRNLLKIKGDNHHYLLVVNNSDHPNLFLMNNQY